MRAFFAISLGCVGLLLGGCANYVGIARPDLKYDQYKRIYVVNNLDDNHHIDVLLVSSLRALGKEVEAGPETMMPDEIDAVITYRDHWTWDFSDHLVAMDLALTEAHKDKKTLATAHFTGAISMYQQPDKVSARLVKELFTPRPSKKK